MVLRARGRKVAIGALRCRSREAQGGGGDACETEGPGNDSQHKLKEERDLAKKDDRTAAARA